MHLSSICSGIYRNIHRRDLERDLFHGMTNINIWQDCHVMSYPISIEPGLPMPMPADADAVGAGFIRGSIERKSSIERFCVLVSVIHR